MKKPVLAITMGDPAGIGPEVTVKALQYRDLWDKCIPIVVGDAYVLEDALRFPDSIGRFVLSASRRKPSGSLARSNALIYMRWRRRNISMVRSAPPAAKLPFNML